MKLHQISNPVENEETRPRTKDELDLPVPSGFVTGRSSHDMQFLFSESRFVVS